MAPHIQARAHRGLRRVRSRPALNNLSDFGYKEVEKVNPSFKIFILTPHSRTSFATSAQGRMAHPALPRGPRPPEADLGRREGHAQRVNRIHHRSSHRLTARHTHRPSSTAPPSHASQV
jgi:hypothetical protein